MTMTHERFLQGMTPQDHMARMKINRERFSRVLAGVQIPAEDAEFFVGLSSPLRVAVFTEDWCGDHVSTTPVLYRLAEDAGNLEVRVFMRDQNLELANAFLPENRWGTVPVFVFFDPEDMREVSRFIETSQELVPAIDGMDETIRSSHPEAPDIGSDVNEMSQDTRELLRKGRGEFRIKRAAEWGRIISRDFREVVAAGLSSRPEEGPAESGTKWPP